MTQNEDATYNVISDYNKSITIYPKLGAYLTYKWATIEGEESPLIEKIGFSIESQNLNDLLANCARSGSKVNSSVKLEFNELYSG